MERERSNLPKQTQNVLQKCSELLTKLESEDRPKSRDLKNEERENICQLFREIIKDLRNERTSFCDVISECLLSAQFAESLTADVIHIVSSSKKVRTFSKIPSRKL